MVFEKLSSDASPSGTNNYVYNIKTSLLATFNWSVLYPDPHTTQVFEVFTQRHPVTHTFDPFISSKLWAPTHWCTGRQMYDCITRYIMCPIFSNPAALFSGRKSGRLRGAELCPDGCSDRPPARLIDESNCCSYQTRSDGEGEGYGTGMIRWDEGDRITTGFASEPKFYTGHQVASQYGTTKLNRNGLRDSEVYILLSHGCRWL